MLEKANRGKIRRQQAPEPRGAFAATSSEQISAEVVPSPSSGGFFVQLLDGSSFSGEAELEQGSRREI